MAGYTIVYWGDANEVAYLDWSAVPDPDNDQAESYAHQFERINPAFARFLSKGEITEVLEHHPNTPPDYTEMELRMQWWVQQLREQGYTVED